MKYCYLCDIVLLKVFEFPGSWNLAFKIDSEPLGSGVQNLFAITGGTPREIVFLRRFAQDKTPNKMNNKADERSPKEAETWLLERRAVWALETDKFVNSQISKKAQYLKFLDAYFNPRYQFEKNPDIGMCVLV